MSDRAGSGADGAVIVVAVGAHEVAHALAELAAFGQPRTEQLAPDRLLVSVHVAEQGAQHEVEQLRAGGWSAVLRPRGGGHLRAWRAHTAPTVIGRVAVAFPWAEFDRAAHQVVVEIDPGRGFGTGDHPSTRLLLAELEARLVGGERVLDVGSGSGVLALVAAALGASAVDAIDTEPEALVATAANAHRNGFADVVEVRGADLGAVTAPYDVIVANVHQSGLLAMAERLPQLLAPTGWLGLAGLSHAQVSRVLAAYRQMTVLALPTDGEWSGVVLAFTPPA